MIVFGSGVFMKWSRTALSMSLGREFDHRLSTLLRWNSGHMLPESANRPSNVIASATVFCRQFGANGHRSRTLRVCAASCLVSANTVAVIMQIFPQSDLH